MSDKLTIVMTVFCSSLVLYNTIFDGIHLLRAQKNVKNVKEEKESLEKHYTRLDCITSSLAMILLFVLFVFFIWDQKIPKIVPFLLFSLPYLLRRLVDTIKSSDSFAGIISGKKSGNEFTAKEKSGFETFAMGILLLCATFPAHRVTSVILSWQYSRTVLGLFISLIYVIYVFTLTFCTAVLLVLPLKHCRYLTDFIARKVGSQYKKLVSFSLNLWERPVFTARLTNSYCEELKHQHFVKKLLVSPVVIVLFLADFVIAFLRVIHAYILCSVGIVLELLLLMGKAIQHLLRIITDIPEHKVMKDWFRISGIISISFIVIANRFSLLFIADENSTAVLEFIASAIIIPIIFEWIYSAKGSKT